jgi:hypothetical protein
MTDYDDSIDDGLSVSGGTPITGSLYNQVSAENATLSNSFIFTFGWSLIQTIQLADTEVYKWIAGALMSELLKLADTPSPTVNYSLSEDDVLQLSNQLALAIPVTISQGLQVSDVFSLISAILMLQRFKVSDVFSSNSTFNYGISDQLQAYDALYDFAALSLDEDITLTSLPTYNYVGSTSLIDNLAISQTLGHSMTFNLTTPENMELSDDEVLNMVYQGDPLLERILLTALYVSPSGNYTTWALNTRTNALSEYRDWVFNSFASMGRKYIAADENGLYELNGERDLEENIVATLKSGLIQMAGTKLAGLKGLYIGMRVTQGNNVFFVKLHAGDGREYIYRLVSQPNIMNTKVNVGKGLRSRYFSFELQSTGPDWDLDTIEFVPMIGQRRV